MMQQKEKYIKHTLLFMVYLILSHITLAQVPIKEKILPTGFYKVVEKSSYRVIDPESREILFLDTAAICSAKDFKKVSLIFNETQMPEIQIQLGEQGAEKFAKATKDYIGKRVAIVTNGKLFVAPIVHSEISGGRLNITGNFSVPELEGIIERLRKEANIQVKFKEEEKKESAINEACTMFDTFLMQADTVRLKTLLHDKLSLGHSNGSTETKAELLHHLGSGYLKYNNIEERGYSEVQFLNTIATVRRQIRASGILQGIPFELNLKVLETWILEGNSWKLLNRQSLKKQ